MVQKGTRKEVGNNRYRVYKASITIQFQINKKSRNGGGGGGL